MAYGAEDDGEEMSEGDDDSPEGILTSAGFDDDQAAALVSAMRACYASEDSPMPKKGKGVDLAIVFGGGKKKK